MARAAMVLGLSLAAATAQAGTAERKSPSMNWDNPTVGTLGAKPAHSGGSASSQRNAAPPAPVAAAPLPSVSAERPVENYQTNFAEPSALPAAPRPDAAAEGSPAGSPAGAQVTAPAPFVSHPTGFLPDHPFVSGLLAGLIGTGLGSILYGGQMMGDQSAVMIGFFGRIALIGLAAVLGLRVIWGMMMGGRDDDHRLAPATGRREPSFERRPEAPRGRRREPHL